MHRHHYIFIKPPWTRLQDRFRLFDRDISLMQDYRNVRLDRREVRQ